MEQFLREISDDRERGASELGRRCLEILAETARSSSQDNETLFVELQKLAENMQRARPSMAPLQNLVQRWLSIVKDQASEEPQSIRQVAVDEANRLIDYSLRAVKEIAEYAKPLARDKTIITHSLSSTMREVFCGLQCHNVRVIATESRPLYEGHKLAECLSSWNIPTALITDAQISVFVEEADIAMVGVDTMLADGSIVNKAGTLLLALAAREANIPFYACCETFKFSDKLPEDVEPEEYAADELGAPDLPHVTPRNIYFDITPAHLITERITEEGIVEKD